MRLRFLMAVIAVGLAAGASSAAADANDAQRLRGVWIAVSAERNGGAADDLKGHQLTFSGDRFTIRSKGKLLYQGTFRVDPSKKPATIDFTHTRGSRCARPSTPRWAGSTRTSTSRCCSGAGDPGLIAP